MLVFQKHSIRLRISTDTAEWLRAYAKGKGISLNRAITNAILNEKDRSEHRRLTYP